MFESTKCGTQFLESGRRAAGLLSEFSTYQVLLDLVDLFALQNTEVLHFTECDCTQTYVNTFGTKQSVCINVSQVVHSRQNGFLYS